MKIKRILYSDLTSHLTAKEISIIIGPRQVGKITLMREIEKDLIKKKHLIQTSLLNQGPHVNNFEDELAKYTSVKHVAALSSGTPAIHLALILLGVKHNDEVICQSFTFSASANPIAYQGAIPIFVDSEKETWNMDPVLIEKYNEVSKILNSMSNTPEKFCH